MVDFHSNAKPNRFVCPNDRQLSLRAKLKTGWSIKTTPPPAAAPQTLDEAEQAAIFGVIRRAEQLDRVEQERVGRLVERLEGLRRAAVGRHAGQCLLCGEAFGLVVGAHRLRCADCARAICPKCAVGGAAAGWWCLICAETREIWKKSGAWFFKALPRSGGRRERKASARGEEEGGSDEERQKWRGKERLVDLPESIEDTPPMSSLNEPRASTSQPSPLWEDPELPPDSRRDSTLSQSISEWNWSVDISEPKLSPSASSGHSNLFRIDENTKPSAESLGSVELSLSYDPLACTLHCTVHRAKNLTPMDINGLADPFCKLNILPNAKISTRLRTKTVHKTRNPEFNERLTFYDVSAADLGARWLHVLVVDDDRFGHDFMGETRITLGKLRQQKSVYVAAALEKLQAEVRGPIPAPELNEWFDDLWSRGQILLSLCYSTKRRSLLVVVCKCVNLLPMDNNGFSDPFVKLQLKPDPCHRKHKTSIKWKNLNPVYNEEFAFETRPTELATQSLYVTVFDKDYGKSNDYLGGLVLGGNGKGLRLKQWLDMIRYPDHRHEAWHNLTEEILE